MHTKIKICGLTSVTDAQIINKELPDFTGIVMYFPKSKRNRTPEQAREILAALDPAVTAVAVVVSPDVSQVREIASLGFDVIQIHGALPDEVLESCELPVWKAFNLSDLPDYERYSRNPKITGCVFDAAEPGSGKTFDWNELQALPADGKLRLLAGGLTPDNVTAAICAIHPDVVDVSSAVEFTDGRPGKDPDKVKSFIGAVRRPL